MSDPTEAPSLLARLAPLAGERPRAAARTTEACRLATLATAASTRRATDRAVRDRLGESLRRLTGGGWGHDEIERVVALRAHAPGSAQVYADLRALDGDTAEPWWGDEPWFAALVGRCDDPTEAVVATASILAVLAQMSPLPWSITAVTDDDDLDRTVLRKVRALLAKAESTDFQAEADALTAKAQDLITRHALDGLDLDPDQRTEVRSRRITLDAPYANAKAILLSQIAAANRCRSVQCAFTATSTVIGVPADLSAVEVLYTSLLTQATTAMLAAGSVEDRAGRNRTKSFRRSFLLGFAQRIGQRLSETSSAAVAAGDAVSLLPALRARSAAVDEAVREAFPSLTKRQIVHSNLAGYGAGDRAGASADLSRSRVRGPRGSLSA